MHRLKNAPVIMVIRRTFSYGKVFIFPILCRHYNYCGKTAKKKKKQTINQFDMAERGL